MLEIMLPNLVPVQAPVSSSVPVPAPVQTPSAKVQRTRVQAPVSDPAPVAVNTSPVVGAPLVAVVNALAVAQAPAGVQQLVGQVQDLVLQHVAVQNVVPEISTAMEVEDEDALLQRLFFKRFGRALPEKEKESEVDQIKFVIDLTDDTDEMESDPTPALIPVVKTEPAESVPDVTNVAKLRQERRELVKGRKALIAFGKTLRKSNVIPEKEAPTHENVVAGSNVSEDTSVNTVKTAEQAEMDADQKEFVAEFGDIPLDEFDDESEFRLYGPEDVLPSDDEDAMIDNV